MSSPTSRRSPIPILLAEALEDFEEHVHPRHAYRPTNGGRTVQKRPQPVQRTQHIWDIAADLLPGVSKEALDRLPTDGAA